MIQYDDCARNIEYIRAPGYNQLQPLVRTAECVTFRIIEYLTRPSRELTLRDHSKPYSTDVRTSERSDAPYRASIDDKLVSVQRVRDGPVNTKPTR